MKKKKKNGIIDAISSANDIISVNVKKKKEREKKFNIIPLTERQEALVITHLLCKN